jgi:heme/copper-type cytochrome/quinol oxidase subunit 2
MPKMMVLERSKSWAVLIALCSLIAVISYMAGSETTSTVPSFENEKSSVREIRMVTGEYKSGELESYRWDPGTVVVHEGDHVVLRIYGVNGKSHPFEIRGLGIKGKVVQGKETVVEFHANKPGIYELVCLTHPTIEQDGPMVGYIVVLDK